MFLLAIDYLVQAQIKVEKFKDNERKNYTEKIVFEFPDPSARVAPGGTRPKVKKEYNIQENNPYNKLSYSIDRTRKGGDKVFSLNRTQAYQLFPSSRGELEDTEEVVVSSHFYTRIEGEHAIIGYNLFGYDGHGEVREHTRKSTIKVLNSTGDEVYSREENSDAYELLVTPDGKYATYAYGEATHDATPEEYGIKIIDLQTENEFYSVKGYASLSYYKYNYLIVRASNKEGYFSLILDTETNELFKLKGRIHTVSERSFKSTTESDIILDLTPYLIK